MRNLDVIDLGRLSWDEAWSVQREYVDRRKAGLVPDTLLFVEHPHVITLGRNAQESNILAGRELLDQLGVSVREANRGGDVTYHGPGQLVGYPIFDLAPWKRDVRAYVEDGVVPSGVSKIIAVYVVVPGGAKYEKIRTAAALALMNVAPSRAVVTETTAASATSAGRQFSKSRSSTTA